MAVPKKRVSKAKKMPVNLIGKEKHTVKLKKALSLAKSVLKGQTTSFIYNLEE